MAQLAQRLQDRVGVGHVAEGVVVQLQPPGLRARPWNTVASQVEREALGPEAGALVSAEA
jgi:hypothetical protein